MAEIVYVLCAATSALCALLLYKKFRKRKNAMLFWSALCFLGFALNNALLFIDVIVVPQYDLSVLRILPAVTGVAALLYGLVKEAA